MAISGSSSGMIWDCISTTVTVEPPPVKVLGHFHADVPAAHDDGRRA